MTLQEITPLIEQLAMPDKVKVYELLVKQISLPAISNRSIKKRQPENDISSKAEPDQSTSFEYLLNLVAERDKAVWAELATK